MSYDPDQEKLAQFKQCVSNIGSLDYIHPTLQEQIEARITDLKTNLRKQEELLELLRRNPDIQRVFELMR